MNRRARFGLLRALVSLALLAALAAWLNLGAVADHVRQIHPHWLAAALVLGTLQFALSAERWRRTAARLEVPLGKREALAGYYLAGFANQVLLGGIVGDAGRAWRHSQSSGRPGPAIRAVVIERASGQFVLLLAVFATLAASENGIRLAARLETPTGGGWAIAAVGMLLPAGLYVAWRRGRTPGWLASLARDTNRALLNRDEWPAHLLLSLAVVSTYCAIFVCAGRMIGADVSSTALAALAPVVLLSMLVPGSVAGWGVRETAAAGVWAALGWPPAEGVAVSVAYGALCLAASLPGAFVPALVSEPRAWRSG